MTPWHSQGRYIRTAEGMPVCKLAQGMEAHGPLIAGSPQLLAAVRPLVAMTYREARNSGGRLMYCRCDVLNPCFDNRPDDIPGKHWGGGDACPECILRAALAAAAKTEREEQAS